MYRKVTDKEKKSAMETIKEIANNLGLSLKNVNNVFSRYNYNKYLFEYDSFYSDIKLELVVETSYYQVSYPIVKCSVNSYIGEFCNKNKINMPVDFQAQLFEMNVQSLERTFIDKVFAVCDYKIQNMMDRDSRHLYDIAKIFEYITFDDNLKHLISRELLESLCDIK